VWFFTQIVKGTGRPRFDAEIQPKAQGAIRMASKNIPEQPHNKPAASGQAPKRGELSTKDLDKVAGGRPPVIGRKGELTE